MPDFLDFINTDLFKMLLVVLLFISIVIFILNSRKPKPISYVYDHNNELVYEVYQLQNNTFAVMGYNGYARQANFKTYIDVEIYIRTNLYGFDAKEKK